MPAVPLGAWLGSLMPWADQRDARAEPPLRFCVWLCVFALPNVLIISAILFALATMTRSMMATYIGVVGFLILYFASQGAHGRPAAAPRPAVCSPIRSARPPTGEHALLDGGRTQHAWSRLDS